MNRLRNTLLALTLVAAAHGMAKDVKDTLFSASGDRIIVSYSIVNNGGQVTVRFQGVQKKLGSKNLEKYRKLDEVAVVMFDRSGNYKDVKFDGMAPDAFMVPSNLSYTRSSDGYFLLQDEPSVQFGLTSGNKAELSIPLYLAHYEGKRHYKVFAKCGNLALSSSASQQRKGAGGGQMAGGGNMEGGGGGYETVTATEEVISDEGISPLDEAEIRMNSVNSMLERATKFPLSEDLTHEVQMLRELRFKVTDPAVSARINQTLEAFEAKKQALEEKADAAGAAAQAQQAAAAQAQQARTDSIQAAQAQQQSKDKKDMMLLIGGIAGLGALLMVGKQVMQTIKQNKQQKQMMDNLTKAQQASRQMMGLGADNPLGQAAGQVNQMATQAKQAMGKVQQAEMVGKHLSKEAEAARQRLMQLSQGKGAQEAAAAGTDAAEAAAAAAAAGTATGKRLSPEAEAARQRLMQLRQGKSAQTAANAGGANGAASPGITVTPKKGSLNDVIPAKYKRWRKPGQDKKDNQS